MFIVCALAAFYFRKKTRHRGPHTEEPEPLLLKPPLFFSPKPSLPPAPPAGVAVSTMSDVNRIKKVQSTRAACA